MLPSEELSCRICGRAHALVAKIWQCAKCGDLVCFGQLWVGVKGHKEPMHPRAKQLCGPVTGIVLTEHVPTE